jgi:predicted RNA-binding protein with PUA-like domain
MSTNATTVNYWLVKTEPGEFSFEDLLRDGRTVWDGVRNFQARNNLSAMALGDLVLVYHSISHKAIVGVATVARSGYPDPTDNAKGQWIVVDLAPVKALASPVTLAQIKTDHYLSAMPLVKQSRLSVMPLSQADFNKVLALGETAWP